MFNGINLATLQQRNSLGSYFFLFEDITPDAAKNVCEWILENNMVEEDSPDHLTLIVNSDGGCLASGFAICDFIRGSKIPVQVIGVGCIASAGLLIVSSGAKGMRSVSENCQIMSHSFSTGIAGTKHDLVAFNKEINNIQARLIRHFKKVTGLPEKKVEELLMPQTDVWLTPKEAVELNLIDHVKDLK